MLKSDNTQVNNKILQIYKTLVENALIPYNRVSITEKSNIKGITIFKDGLSYLSVLHIENILNRLCLENGIDENYYFLKGNNRYYFTISNDTITISLHSVSMY